MDAELKAVADRWQIDPARDLTNAVQPAEAVI
jgi:hypothetical protein